MNDSQLIEQADVLSRRAVDLHTRDELLSKLRKAGAEGRPLRVKYGADPSAPDIHLGHVVGLNKLREFQEMGHTVVFIIGDFTGMIGDPSGRSQTRKPLTVDQVEANAKTYQEQVFKLLDPERTEIRFNSHWLLPLGFDQVIRLSAHVTVAQLLARDDFSKRYGSNQPISLVEFLYPLVQAYDSVVVRADVEIGGTDQLFNLLLGRELQKAMGQEPQVVMTLPLLEGLDGVQKMSKSLNNYIGISESPKDIFGKSMSVSDDLMWRYFSLVLRLPEVEISGLKDEVASGRRHPRDVKDEMARKIVEMFYGAEAGVTESDAFARVFSQGQIPEDIKEVHLDGEAMAGEGVGILSLLVDAGLASSNSEARRLVQQGAVKLGEEKVTDPKAMVKPATGTILRSGKRGWAKLTW
ncbi:MAG TPA: tyrosine--tRNA ligase [Kiritimatiellia bacterium]|nr:tyrosine--tRNA ligase [Kiritimatiellia bacterium]